MKIEIKISDTSPGITHISVEDKRTSDHQSDMVRNKILAVIAEAMDEAIEKPEKRKFYKSGNMSDWERFT